MRWLPVVTNVSLLIPGVFVGSFLLEIFFSIPGLGREIYLAVNRSDYPVIQAVTIYLSVLTMLINLGPTLLYTFVDRAFSYAECALLAATCSRMRRRGFPRYASSAYLVIILFAGAGFSPAAGAERSARPTPIRRSSGERAGQISARCQAKRGRTADLGASIPVFWLHSGLWDRAASAERSRIGGGHADLRLQPPARKPAPANRIITQVGDDDSEGSRADAVLLQSPQRADIRVTECAGRRMYRARPAARLMSIVSTKGRCDRLDHRVIACEFSGEIDLPSRPGMEKKISSRKLPTKTPGMRSETFVTPAQRIAQHVLAQDRGLGQTLWRGRSGRSRSSSHREERAIEPRLWRQATSAASRIGSGA